MNKYNVGDIIYLKGRKRKLVVESVKYSNYSNKYIYTFVEYPYWAYENEIGGKLDDK